MGRLTAFREEVYPPTSLLLLEVSKFSLGTARTLAWASQLAYEVNATGGKFDRIGRNWEWTKVDTVRQSAGPADISQGIKGFVAQAKDATIVTFAGTEPESARNWITNFNFVARDDNGICRGFYDAVDVVWNELEQHVSRLNGRPLYITGHSLGGALAVVAAWRLPAAIQATIRGIYTFGMPRPGNAAFAANYHEQSPLGAITFRLRHGEDVVPTVAPRVTGACHVGRLLPCAHGGSFDETHLEGPGPETDAAGTVGEMARHFFRVPRREPALPLFPSDSRDVEKLVGHLPQPVRDHLMDRYLWALQDPAIRALPH